MIEIMGAGEATGYKNLRRIAVIDRLTYSRVHAGMFFLFSVFYVFLNPRSCFPFYLVLFFLA
jgi:hypothetical protein